MAHTTVPPNRKHSPRVRARLQRQAFQWAWLADKTCNRCGRSFTRRRVAVLVHRAGIKTPMGFWNGCAATKLRFLADCDTYCNSCSGFRSMQQHHGFPDSTPEERRQQIENGLLEFRNVKDVAGLAHTDVATVAAIAQALRDAANACGCGRMLAHSGRCIFRREMVREEPKEPAPQPAAPRDPSRCTADNACPFPPVRDGVCRQHSHFYELPSDLLGDQLEPWDFVPTPTNPAPLLHMATRWELDHYQTTIRQQRAA